MIAGQTGFVKSWLVVELGRRLGLTVSVWTTPSGRPVGQNALRLTSCSCAPRSRRGMIGSSMATYLPQSPAAPQAGLAVWLDLPVKPRLWRITWRKITGFGQRRPDMAAGCLEQLGRETCEFYR